MKKPKNLMLINNLDFQDEFKSNLIDKIKRDLRISKDDLIISNDQIFYFCLRFVENYSGENGLKQARREFELGNFFISTSFPLVLFEVLLIKLINLVLFLKIAFWIIIPYFTICYAIKRYSLHRNAWIRSIYRLFYLTEK